MVKLKIFLAIIGCSSIVVKDVTPLKKDTTRAKTDAVKEKVWDLNEVSPEFPGGAQKFREFVRANLKKIGAAAGKKVIVCFIVEKDGSITDIKIGRGVSEEANQEAIRIMNLSPKWIPGTQLGKVVRIACTAPIIFN